MAKRILVIEDDKNISELLQIYLEKEGFETKVAKDGGKGVEYFRSFQPALVLFRHIWQELPTDRLLPVSGHCVLLRISLSRIPEIQLR